MHDILTSDGLAWSVMRLPQRALSRRPEKCFGRGRLSRLPGQEVSHSRSVGLIGPAGPTISLLLLNAGDFLAVGDDDYWILYDGTVEMYTELRRIGLKPELRVGDGGHNWKFWRLMTEDVFHFFDANLRAAK